MWNKNFEDTMGIIVVQPLHLECSLRVDAGIYSTSAQKYFY